MRELVKVRELVNRYLEKAGIDKRGVHLLRHTFATHSLSANPNIRALQEVLGHKNIITTQKYAHISRDDLRKQTEGLPANRFGEGALKDI